MSLQTLARVFLGLSLEKNATMSDWSLWPLGFIQKRYAAIDAVLALRLGSCLIRRLQNKYICPIFNLNTPLNDPKNPVNTSSSSSLSNAGSPSSPDNPEEVALIVTDSKTLNPFFEVNNPNNPDNPIITMS